MATVEEIHVNSGIRNHYNLLRGRGFPHEDALRLAHGNLGPSVVGTDTQLFLSKSDDGFQNDTMGRRDAIAKARRAGVSTTGKTFVPGLCRRGVVYDPQAWVNDKAEVVKKAEKLGCNVVGSIQHTTPIRDEHIAATEAPYQVSRDVVAGDVAQAITERYGGTATAAQTENLFQEKVEKHSGNK